MRGWDLFSDLESIPLSGLHLVAVPGVRPFLDAFSMAAEFEGESAETSISGAHFLRETHFLGLGDDQASSGGPTERM